MTADNADEHGLSKVSVFIRQESDNIGDNLSAASLVFVDHAAGF